MKKQDVNVIVLQKYFAFFILNYKFRQKIHINSDKIILNYSKGGKVHG